MRRNLARPLGLCVLLLAPSVEAQIVKCIDAEGSVTYSDMPCLRTEKRALVDTRASTNVMEFSSIRAQKSRVLAPAPPPPVYSSSAPPPPPPPPAPFTVDRSIRPAVTY